jgi:hybrid cluster-associated redox disulfide protein
MSSKRRVGRVSHNENTITKDMTIAEALRAKPAAAKVFMSHGMHCLGCATAAGETIAQAAVVHGIDLDGLLTQLNS